MELMSGPMADKACSPKRFEFGSQHSHQAASNHSNSCFSRSKALFWPPGILPHKWHSHILIQKYKNKLFKNKNIQECGGGSMEICK